MNDKPMQDLKPSDIKQAARDAEDETKAALRRADGDESLQDKVANTTDRIRTSVETAGDKVHERVDELAREAEYLRGRLDQKVEDERRDEQRRRA